MSFQDIACYVWAINGYRPGTESAAVQERFQYFGNKLRDESIRFRQASDAVNRHDRIVRSLLEMCRIDDSASFSRQCTVYGDFDLEDPAAGSPAHMWIEYDGYIYDTQPGLNLHRTLANDVTRYLPPSIRIQDQNNWRPCHPLEVGIVQEWPLTVTQHWIIIGDQKKWVLRKNDPEYVQDYEVREVSDTELFPMGIGS